MILPPLVFPARLFVPVKILQLILMFTRKAGAYLSEAPFRRSTLGGLLALPTNFRLGWKGLPETNTLAYHEHSEIPVVKSFITLGPRANYIKLFLSVIYGFS